VERMMLDPWPSNVRELAAVLDGIAMAERAEALPLWLVDKVLVPSAPAHKAALTLDRVKEAIRRCDGNESQAARELGITRGKLRRFLKTNAKQTE